MGKIIHNEQCSNMTAIFQSNYKTLGQIVFDGVNEDYLKKVSPTLFDTKTTVAKFKIKKK